MVGKKKPADFEDLQVPNAKRGLAIFQRSDRGQADGQQVRQCQMRPAGMDAYFFLPPRVYCPDCLEKMGWCDITDLARKTAKVHTHITVNHPGGFNRVPMPCQLILVEIDQVATVPISVLEGGEPEIGLEIEPVFNTGNPTFTILDLSWKRRH
jgi:uncharacterized OB-fold protein